LITLDEQHHAKSTALEISAGAKLYNVVVENEQIGKDLLQNGKLKKRVTIIPLNKINSFRASAQKLTAAKKIGGDKVNLALSLVGYENEVANAMAFVFGDTLICDDAESAKAVTFNSAVGLKSVTLDGDVYDPSGTLSGGSAPSSSGLLVKVQELKEAETNLHGAKAALIKLEKEEENNKGARDAWQKLARELEIKEHEVKLLDEQLGGSNAARVSPMRFCFSMLLVLTDVGFRLVMRSRRLRSRLRICMKPPVLASRNRSMRKPNVRSLKQTWTISRTTKKAKSRS